MRRCSVVLGVLGWVWLACAGGAEPVETKAAEHRATVLSFIKDQALADRGYTPERVAYVMDQAGEAALLDVFKTRVGDKALTHERLDDILHALNKAIAGQHYAQVLVASEDSDDKLVLPGIVADRAAKRVVLLAQATGLTAQGSPPEFFIIAEKSGHDYEALSVALAKPSDLHRALVFIGMEPGRRVNAEKLQFWPKGERVLLTFSAQISPEKKLGPFPMNQLFLDKKTGRPIAVASLVFTGSAFVDSPTEPGKSVYAADVYGPHALAANYNEPTAVLDIPRQAPQKDVYGNMHMNPETLFPPLALLEIVIEPEYKDGKQRVVDLEMAVKPLASATGHTISDVAVTLKNIKGDLLVEQVPFEQVLARLDGLIKAGHDPFVTLRFDGALPLGAARQVSEVLSALDSDKGLRMEPPPEGHLYYRAFNPDPSFKDRSQRYAQPWELRLQREDDHVTGVLTQLIQTWRDGQVVPDIEAKDFPVASGQALLAKLQELGPGLKVVLVFAPPTLRLDELMAFVNPIRSSYPLIHVFTEKQP